MKFINMYNKIVISNTTFRNHNIGFLAAFTSHSSYNTACFFMISVNIS